MHKHARVGGSGGMLPEEILEIRCFEAVLGQKESRIVATWLIKYCIQFLAMHLLKLADIKFSREKVLRFQNSR